MDSKQRSANSIGLTPRCGAQTFEFEKAADEMTCERKVLKLLIMKFIPFFVVIGNPSICVIPFPRAWKNPDPL